MKKLKHNLGNPILISKYLNFDINNIEKMIDMLIFNGLSVNNILISIYNSLNNIIYEKY